ncbi:MAG: hypothetical protein R3D98_05880 [Candidatus Krumholzibacteriia bacterium]
MPRVSVLVLLLLLAVSGLALAQEPMEGDAPVVFDPVVAPLVQPDVDDFIADPLPDGVEPAALAVSAYTEVTSALSVVSVAPRYRVNEWLQARVRVPWVLQRKFNYFGHEATGSGLGDVSVDLAYRRALDAGRQRLEFMASVKLPTGDDENEDDDGYAVPLGTGTVDLVARGMYARHAQDYGLLASAMFRRNSANDVTVEYPSTVPGEMVRSTTSTTNANQFVGSVFGRYRADAKLWLHLGASITVTGQGKSETETVDPASGTSTSAFDLEQGSTLVDLFPGVSYQLGLFQPYVGARIPVSTSFDNGLLTEDRDTAIVFQVSYNPTRFLAD